MPDFTIASAICRIMSSLTLQPNLFQLFHPMGGVRTRLAEGLSWAISETAPARSDRITTTERFIDCLVQSIFPCFDRLRRDLLTQCDRVKGIVLRQPTQDGQLRPEHVAVGDVGDYLLRGCFNSFECLRLVEPRH